MESLSLAIINSIKEDRNYDLIKDVVGARIFYHSISVVDEKIDNKDLYISFESAIYKTSNYNNKAREVLKEYIMNKNNSYNIKSLGYLLIEGSVVGGVYYYKNEDKIIFVRNNNAGVYKEESLSLDEIVNNDNINYYPISSEFYDNYIFDLFSKFLFSSLYYNKMGELFYSCLKDDNNYGLLKEWVSILNAYSNRFVLSFIVGCGVNDDIYSNLSKESQSVCSLPDSLSPGGWGNLIKIINSNISYCLKKGSSFVPNIKDFNEGMSNINYFSPEMLKLLDKKKYDDVIFDFLYGDNHKSIIVDKLLNKKYNPNIKNTYLYKIAEYMSKNPDSKFLSFNYDDFFDRIYKYSVGLECNNTVNPHGFIKDYRLKAISKPNSDIVLSSFEYMNGYSFSNNRARRITREHLDRVNVIIGNSLSDYEEQKVFRLRYLKNRSHRSFLFAKELDDIELNIMKALYFSSIGVIYCPIKDYSEISNFLDQINK